MSNRKLPLKYLIRRSVCLFIAVTAVAFVIITAAVWCADKCDTNTSSTVSTENTDEIINKYAENHSLDPSQWPKSIRQMLAKNRETEDFVLSYPTEKDKKQIVDLSEYEDCEEVPLLMQFDKRWGYKKYGSDVAALTSCGPVCLSMAAIYLTNDTSLSPDYIMDFAVDNGYCIEGNGTAWALIHEGGEKLGLTVKELPLSEQRVMSELEKSHPIICIMGAGDFTESGHYIVLAGVDKDKLIVNDPNSISRSQKRWSIDEIGSQIRNMWSLSI